MPMCIYVYDQFLQETSSSLTAAKEATGLLDKERRDWKIRQAEMVRQIADLQEECRLVFTEIVNPEI